MMVRCNRGDGMRLLCILLTLLGTTDAFTGSSPSDTSTTGLASVKTRSTRASLAMANNDSGFFDNLPGFDKIPNLSIPSVPFGTVTSEEETKPDTSFDPETFEPLPENLIARAKTVILTDLGIQDASLLNEEFIWIGPLLEKPLDKVDYLAAGKFFNIRGAFPDLDYRAHDFRIDSDDPMTVRCTVRPVGSMRGSLRLRNEVVEPNGKQWRGPPEGVSMKFDSKGRLVKLCSGFALDRAVGNTNGLCGVMAAATISGVPPSDWEIYPVPAVISRFFGRPLEPLPEVSTFLAPFPETVMIQLVKGIVSADLGADDPTLLTKDFVYLTPLVGPIGKEKFLEEYARQEFGGYEPETSHFRVDPYDPYRVWVDIKVAGPGLEGPPQAFSFAFDDDGFCTRITGGAILDPSIGNTGGLSGEEGIRYALGQGSLDVTTRPLPLAIGRLKKSILSPITNIDADEYLLEGQASKVTQPKPPISKPPAVKAETSQKKTIAESQVPIKPKPPADLPEPSREKRVPKKVAKKSKPTKGTSSPSNPLFFSTTISPAPKTSAKKEPAMKKSGSKDTIADAIAAAKAAQARAAAEKEKRRAAEVEEQKKRFELEKQKAEEQRQTTQAKKAEQEASRNAAAEERQRKAEEQKERIELEKQKAEDERKAAAEKSRQEQAAKKARQEKQARKQKLAAAEALAAQKEKSRQEQAAKKARQEEQARKQKLAAAEALAAQKEKSRRELEAKKAARAAEARKLAEERRIAAENARQEAEAKRIAAAEERRRKADEIKKTLEQRKQEAAAKRAAAAEKRRTVAQPRPTAPVKAPSPKKQSTTKSAEFSFFNFGSPKQTPSPSPPPPPVKPKRAPPPAPLFNFGGSPKPQPTKAVTKPAAKAPVLASAPKGVPTVVKWRQTPKGGIAGLIFGAEGFKEGERVETSPIASGVIQNGGVVTTSSGSKYYLSDKTVREMRELSKKAPSKVPAGMKAKSAANTGQRPTLQLLEFARKRDLDAKLAKEREASKKRAAAKAALKSVKTAQPRATFSLTALFESIGKQFESPPTKSAAASSKVSKSPVTRKGPRGVPSIGRWKQNRDKSITGFISGSPAFADGDRITTSPIGRGTIAPGEVVVTKSGSRYFLQ